LECGLFVFKSGAKYFGALLVVLCLIIIGAGHFGIVTAPPAKPQGKLRLLTINVLGGNRLTDLTQQALLDAQADVLVLLEWNGNNLDLHKFIQAGYELVIDQPTRGVHGLALLSKIPGRAVYLDSPIESPCSLPLGTFTFFHREERYHLFAAHAPPPIPACGSTTAPYIEFIARQVSAGRLNSGERVLIAGDLNSFPLQAAMRDLRRRGLADSWSQWSPFAPTWRPLAWFPLLARIDYVLYPVEMRSLGAYRLAVEGSDHLGILQDLE
jgi:endonuclease/exonuclease/phosphatase (EEP) superfamily protein YafD